MSHRTRPHARARASAGIRSLPALLLLAGAAALGAPPAAHAVADAFYLDLLRDGTQSYARGDYAVAAKQLRVACFGMLDEPDHLAACLTRLAVAEGAAGNADGFRDTFRRIVEVEDRFGAYNRADLPPDIRSAFEQRALTVVPAAALAALPQFKDLLSRKVEEQLAALSPRERRRQLEERLVKEPKSVVWNVMMAELDLAEGKTAPAAARAEQLAAAVPQDAHAVCLRGLTRAAGDRCKEAMIDLETCYLAGREKPYAAALLGCRIALGEWVKADEQVRALPAGWKDDRKLAALAQQVAKHRPAAGGTAATSGTAGTAGTAGTVAAAAAGTERGGARSGSPAPGSGPAPGTRAGRTGAAGGSPAPTVTNGATADGLASGGGAAARSNPGAPGPGAGGAKAPERSGAGTPSSTAGAGSAPPSKAGGSAAPPSGTAAGGTQAAAVRPLAAADRETMARSEKLLAANDTQDLKEAMRLAREVADGHPDSREAQYLAGEAAYRNARWPEAASYFKRGGLPGDEHPELLFYMAVALYEVGDQPGAAAALRRSLPNLQKTPYVQSYVKRILGQ
jgi:hypothetical protein